MRLLRLFVLALMAVCFALPAPALTLDEANQKLNEAHMLFERGDSARARDIYVEVARDGFPNPQIWTNAGTAAYRAGDTGAAVLYYSRALRLDPTSDRALRSLQFAQPDSNNAEGGTQFLSNTLGIVSPGWWALAAQIGFVVLCFGVARSLSRWNNGEERSHWLIVAGWSVVLTAALVGMTVWTHRHRSGGNDAVVMKSGTIARSEPRPDSVAQLELPAGTIVSLTEQPSRGFVRIKLADGQTGYLSTNDLEAI